jgi:S-adenosylmethionine synthetase
VGRTPAIVTKKFKDGNGNEISRTVELFTWEKTDMVDQIKAEFVI